MPEKEKKKKKIKKKKNHVDQKIKLGDLEFNAETTDIKHDCLIFPRTMLRFVLLSFVINMVNIINGSLVYKVILQCGLVFFFFFFCCCFFFLFFFLVVSLNFNFSVD